MGKANQGTTDARVVKNPNPNVENFKETEVKVALPEIKDYSCNVRERKMKLQIFQEFRS